ncbi:acyl transferase/acyl hydrolase/lysophospholipase, partial [Vararia minispora EC-137]
RHITAFSDALRADDNTFLPDSLPSPTISVSSRPATPGASGQYGGSTRIRKVSALSDFAPVNTRVKKRRKGHLGKHNNEWLFLIFRWPMLSSIFLFIAFLFGLYILIRQLVNAKEYISAWRGRKGLLRKRLRGSQSYDEWKDAARTLDEYLEFDVWKHADEDPFYDWRLVRKVRHSLRTFRKRDDVRGVLGVLETCMRVNFAGIESPRLYSETYYGTKDLIESFIAELEQALEYIRRAPQLSVDEKKRFFKSVNTNFGLTALCLSGGASFGYYHFGVVRALLDAGLLPQVITGTSAGGLVAALTCTRTDVELKELLVPSLASKITACEEPFRVWFKRFWKTGARFDSVLWAEKCSWFTRGSLTFREAYLRTGRILNVSVIPADRHSPTKILNYITAPDTIIWSALLASAAVPGILNPVVLMQKLKDGRAVPWNWGSKFKDGSLRVDIPTQALNLYFNVTNAVVSQVNPHVHLFFFGARGSAGKPVAHRKGKGKGWRGNFVLSAAEQWLKLELTKNFKLIRDLELLPTLLGQDWSSVFLQRFEGSITILPRTRFMDWIRILTDPDEQELERMLRVGQLVTWPKLHIIENRLRLERQVYLGRQAVRKAQQ